MIEHRLSSALLTAAVITTTAVLLFRPSTTTVMRGDAVSEVMAGGLSAGFAIADRTRTFTFPDDHGAHPNFRNEWWYFTGQLDAHEGDQRYGFQLTFFRYELAPPGLNIDTGWRSTRMLLAHFAVTDFARGQFHQQERMFRAIPEIAGVGARSPHLWLDDWSVKYEELNRDLQWVLRAATDDAVLDLRLSADAPVVLQGERGLSRKGASPGNASYYYSAPWLRADGTLHINGREETVSGSVWLDREWSTSALDRNQQGWDWFALRLSDERALMFYQLRNEDGSKGEFSAGSMSYPDGRVVRLSATDVDIQVIAHWTSEKTGIKYPARWRLRIPRFDLSVEVRPLVAAQEWTGRFKYWEGAVEVQATEGGRASQGAGYVELTGYQP